MNYINIIAKHIYQDGRGEYCIKRSSLESLEVRLAFSKLRLEYSDLKINELIWEFLDDR